MTWYPHTVTVAATSEPITTADAIAQCKAQGLGDDAYFATLITSARSYVEAYCGTPLIARTITVKCDTFGDFSAFPVVPLQSVSSVSYVDGNGATQTLATSIYEVRTDGLTASLALKADQSWPTIQTGSRITVTSVVGYSTVPEAVIMAIKFLISQWYDNRTPFSERIPTELPNTVEALLSNYRAFAF